MTEQEIREKVAETWRQAAYVKIDWLAMEACIRETLRLVNRHEMQAETALKLIDETVGAFTLRGQEIEASESELTDEEREWVYNYAMMMVDSNSPRDWVDDIENMVGRARIRQWIKEEKEDPDNETMCPTCGHSYNSHRTDRSESATSVTCTEPECECCEVSPIEG